MNYLGVYIQVPFCQTKCTYCNFHTGVVSAARFAPYAAAACKEIREYRTFYAGAGVLLPEAITDVSVDTVYMGGGTPSLLDPADLRAMLGAVRSTFRCDLQEVTLEADPETVTAEKAAAWVQSGINRISFGLQSFVDKEWIAAGRMHRRADIYNAVAILREVGIRNISVDLIAGLPHQNRQSWEQSLDELTALAPEHVSVYLLEVDEGSRLGKELLHGGTKYSAAAVPSEDEMAENYETAQKVLRQAGYHHYEISNWARPGRESHHNLKYWRREPYLGFGAGAHSFSGTARWANAHDSAAYVNAIVEGKSPIEQQEELTPERALEEELFLGLRQLDGIDVTRIEREYSVTLEQKWDSLLSAGLVERSGNLLRLAPEKISVSNEVFMELLA